MKKTGSEKPAERKYLMNGLLLCGGGIGLLIVTGLIVMLTGRLFWAIPIGAAVLLLIGCGSIMKWMLGDKIMWD